MRRAFVACTLTVTLAACTKEDGDSGHEHHEHHGHGETVTTAMTEGGSFEVSFAVPDGGFPLSEEFDLVFTVNAEDGSPAADAELAVTAWMPDHGHGMNQEPTMTPNGDGTFVASGMLLHMSGAWDVYADVQLDGATESATLSIRCCD